MRIEILEVSRVKEQFQVYILARATEGNMVITESFRFRRRAVDWRIVTDRSGWWKTIDGRFIDPATLDSFIDGTDPGNIIDTTPEFLRESFIRDYASEFLTTMEATMRRRFDSRDLEDRSDQLVERVREAARDMSDTEDTHSIVKRLEFLEGNNIIR